MRVSARHCQLVVARPGRLPLAVVAQIHGRRRELLLLDVLERTDGEIVLLALPFETLQTQLVENTARAVFLKRR